MNQKVDPEIYRALLTAWEFLDPRQNFKFRLVLTLFNIISAIESLGTCDYFGKNGTAI